MNIAVLGDGTLATAIKINIAGEHDLTEPYDAQLLWCCEDVSIEDGVDYRAVTGAIEETCAALDRQLVIISSQLPVGTTHRFETRYPNLRFFVVPENVRAVHAIEDFASQHRIIVGQRHADWRIDTLLRQFTPRLIHMSIESAEMVKHALNGFLALSVAYAQEIARLSSEHGADPVQVARGIMSDPRIGEHAYLRPAGEPGAHLMREVEVLAALGGGPIIKAML